MKDIYLDLKAIYNININFKKINLDIQIKKVKKNSK